MSGVCGAPAGGPWGSGAIGPPAGGGVACHGAFGGMTCWDIACCTNACCCLRASGGLSCLGTAMNELKINKFF